MKDKKLTNFVFYKYKLYTNSYSIAKKNPTKILIGKFNVIFKGNSMTRSISGVIMTDGQSTNPYKLEDVLMMVKLRGIEIFSIGKLEFQASSLTLNYCVRRNLYG